jgi:hypothetical protein
VAAVNPDLVVRDKEGDIYTVRYDAVNTMLLNEFLKARRQIDAQQKQIDALTAGLQKVSAQLEKSKRAPKWSTIRKQDILQSAIRPPWRLSVSRSVTFLNSFEASGASAVAKHVGGHTARHSRLLTQQLSLKHYQTEQP